MNNMQTQLVPSELLQKTNKILFITHLSLGDFTYLQNYFQAFAKRYPHNKIHIWVDEVRRTRFIWKWKHLKNYALYDWLAACPFIHKIYNQTYSPACLKKSIREAQAEKYPLVVSPATLHPHFYARLARSVSPKGFVVGMQNPTHMVNVIKRFSYRKMDRGMLWKNVSKADKHMSDWYASLFERLFGIEVSVQQRFPFINIPNKWIVYAKLCFLKWGIDRESKKYGKVIFINSYAKNNKRSWPLDRVISLIRSIKQRDKWGGVSFIVNTVPEKMAKAQKLFRKHSLNNTFLFTADYNFFQLPAIISLCDLVISVETAVMHFANALHVPLIALMRQKNPEWAPIDKDKSLVITTLKRKDWIKDISIQRVLEHISRAG